MENFITDSDFSYSREPTLTPLNHKMFLLRLPSPDYIVCSFLKRNNSSAPTTPHLSLFLNSCSSPLQSPTGRNFLKNSSLCSFCCNRVAVLLHICEANMRISITKVMQFLVFYLECFTLLMPPRT